MADAPQDRGGVGQYKAAAVSLAAPVRGAAAPANYRAGPGPVKTRSFWPPVEAAQVDYETLRAHLLEHDALPDDLAAARFARRGLAGLIA